MRGRWIAVRSLPPACVPLKGLFVVMAKSDRDLGDRRRDRLGRSCGAQRWEELYIYFGKSRLLSGHQQASL